MTLSLKEQVTLGNKNYYRTMDVFNKMDLPMPVLHETGLPMMFTFWRDGEEMAQLISPQHSPFDKERHMALMLMMAEIVKADSVIYHMDTLIRKAESTEEMEQNISEHESLRTDPLAQDCIMSYGYDKNTDTEAMTTSVYGRKDNGRYHIIENIEGGESVGGWMAEFTKAAMDWSAPFPWDTDKIQTYIEGLTEIGVLVSIHEDNDFIGDLTGGTMEMFSSADAKQALIEELDRLKDATGFEPSDEFWQELEENE